MKTLAMVLTFLFAAQTLSWTLKIPNLSEKKVDKVDIMYRQPNTLLKYFIPSCKTFTFGPLKETKNYYDFGGGGGYGVVGVIEEGGTKEIDAQDCTLHSIRVLVTGLKEALYMAPADFKPLLATDGTMRAGFEIRVVGDSIKVSRDLGDIIQMNKEKIKEAGKEPIKAEPEAPKVEPLVDTKNIDAGPIWSQSDALKKCPKVCLDQQRNWNGNWWTTVKGVNSVCSCVLSKTAPAP